MRLVLVAGLFVVAGFLVTETITPPHSPEPWQEPTFEQKISAAIVDFKESGQDSRKINLQDFTDKKIRKVCDQIKLIPHAEFEQLIGEKIPHYNVQDMPLGNRWWVFFDDSVSFISIPSSDPARVWIAYLPVKAPCSNEPIMTLTHVFIDSDSVGHQYFYDFEGRE
jgi:hypothetical protein